MNYLKNTHWTKEPSILRLAVKIFLVIAVITIIILLTSGTK